MSTFGLDVNVQARAHPLRGLVYGIGALAAVAIACYGIAFPWLLPNIPDAFHQRYLAMSQVLITMHVFAAGMALLIAPLQFVLHRWHRRLHRYLGRCYFVFVMVGSIGGYYMAWHAVGGIISTLGLGILASLWWSSTLRAVMHARTGNIAAHRRWMIRSFALTYAAVTLRVISPVLSLFLDDITQSQVVYWLSWTLNLALAEIWLRLDQRVISRSATAPAMSSI